MFSLTRLYLLLFPTIFHFLHLAFNRSSTTTFSPILLQSHLSFTSTLLQSHLRLSPILQSHLPLSTILGLFLHLKFLTSYVSLTRFANNSVDETIGQADNINLAPPSPKSSLSIIIYKVFKQSTAKFISCSRQAITFLFIRRGRKTWR